MSHDRGVATKAETHRAARWQGGRAWRKGCRAPQHGQGPLPPLYGAPPPALRMSSSTPLSLTPLPTPPASVAAALGLGLGRGSSGSVGASSAGAASSMGAASAGAASLWTWPSMGATSPTAGGVCVSPVSLPSLRAWARACRRE